MFRWIAIGILSITTFAVSIWGYKEHEEKNAILIQAENTYQRAFHELSYHLDLLHDKIGISLAMNSSEQLSPQLVEVWRLTSEAHANVSQLPLTLLPFSKTEEFLSEIGDFTYRTAVRDLDATPLTEEEIDTLHELYDQAEDLKKELRQVQYLTLKNNLRWMDVQLALATEDEPLDNTIIDGFKTVEKKVEGFADGYTDSPLFSDTKEGKEYKQIQGDTIDEQTALKKAKEIFNAPTNSDLSISESGDGAETPIYSISYDNENTFAYIDISKYGGSPLSLLIERPMEEKSLSLNKGLEKAEQYLENFGYKNMKLFQSSEYDHIGVYSFAYEENDITIYPDSIEIKVALDNGDVLGFAAQNYLRNHHKRDIKEPAISVEEAKEAINPNIEIQKESLAIIDNDYDAEVLTYEFLGVYKDETYRIYINAIDGKEEKIERLTGTEIDYSQLF